jgi:hypothetical protein
MEKKSKWFFPQTDSETNTSRPIPIEEFVAAQEREIRAREAEIVAAMTDNYHKRGARPPERIPHSLEYK